MSRPDALLVPEPRQATAVSSGCRSLDQVPETPVAEAHSSLNHARILTYNGLDG